MMRKYNKSNKKSFI